MRLALLCFVLLLAACGQTSAPGHDHADGAMHDRTDGAMHDHAATPGAAPAAPPAGTDDVAAVYTCPMHPEVTSPTEGRCPKCNMFLVKADEVDPTDAANGHSGG